MDKVWNYKKVNKDECVKLAREAGISTLIAKIFHSRGMKNPQEIRSFLDMGMNTYDPYLLKDMEAAVERINEAIDEKQQITVYGDYDADGITSTANLLLFLRSLGAEADYYIPDRLTEGYGLSTKSIEMILEKGTDLIITVDCGVSAIKEAELVYELGADLIITDHHECSSELPQAMAVINPKRPDCTYPFKELAGVGVTYKLIQAICMRRGLGEQYKEFLDLTAIGTVSDIVPLLGENRYIVTEGLKRLANTSNPGLDQLMKVAGIRKEKLNSTSIAFGITPRINAGGRMGKADLALDLFLTKDADKAVMLANELNENNKKRQQLEQEVADKVMRKVESNSEYDDKNVIVVAEEGLHHGVIGIVASRILDRFFKPCIILSIEADEDNNLIAKGSCRSIRGFNIYEALCQCKELIEKYGGHELAAGLSIKPEYITNFDNKINDISREIDKNIFTPSLYADVAIEAEDISANNIESLKLLEPFGQENPVPTFVLEHANLASLRQVGADGQHLKMIFQKGNYYFDAIAFYFQEKNVTLEENGAYDIMFTLENNEWNNNIKPQLKIIEVRPVKNIDLSIEINNIIEQGKGKLYNNNITDAVKIIKESMNNSLPRIDKNEILKFIAGRDDMIKIYKYLQQYGNATMDKLSGSTGMSLFKVSKAVETLVELDLAEGDMRNGYRLKNNKGKKVELEASITYKVMSIIKEVI